MTTATFDALCQRRLDAINVRFTNIMQDPSIKDEKKMKLASRLLKKEMKIQAVVTKVKSIA
jgi:hypothetical protein